MRSKALGRQIHEAEKENKGTRKKEQSQLEEVFQNSKSIRHPFNREFTTTFFSGNRLIAAENASNTLTAKVAILKARVLTLDDDLSKEAELEQKIRSVQPQKPAITHVSKDLKDKMAKLMDSLRQFHTETVAGGDPQVTYTWPQLQEIAQNAPNHFVFQQVMKELDLHNARLSDLNASAASTKSSHGAILEKVMPELNEQIIVGGVNTLSGRRKLALLKSRCSEAIQAASYKLEDLLIDDADNSYRAEDLGRDFMTTMLKNFSLRGKIRLLSEIDSKRKAEVNEQEHSKDSFAMTIQEAQKIDALVEKRLDDGQQNIAQMLMINEKLNSGKFSMARMVQELKNQNKQLSMNRGMKFSQAFGPEVPSHSKELEGFLSIPLGNFEKHCFASSMPAENIFLDSDETFSVLVKQGLVDVLNLCEFLSTAKQSLEWNDVLKIQAAKETNFHSKVLQQVSINELQESLQLNREAISEFLDAISKNHSTAKRLLQECQTLYKYWLDNPLKRFIPDSKKFEGKTFKAYEKDFNLYFRMFRN